MNMRKLIQTLLIRKAKRLIKKHQPMVIGVTGSVGKTSTRDAIAALLATTFDVAKNFENYNNEFGLPLTILQEKSPGRSVRGWLDVLLYHSQRPLQTFPNLFVLEYGVDRPGDMQMLCAIAKPRMAFLTGLSPVHVENFSSFDALIDEKTQLLDSVGKDGIVFLNADDPLVMASRSRVTARVVTYGFFENADVRALHVSVKTREDFSFEPGEHFCETRVDVQLPDHDGFEFILKNTLGRAAIRAVLAGMAVAKQLGVSNDHIIKQIAEIPKQPGRMNPIAGIKGSLIIDSSYNAAPASMQEALDVLRFFSPAEEARRIAVLGNMAELGSHTEQEHRAIGKRATEIPVDLLVTVGELARDIARGATNAGFDQTHMQHFHTSIEAGRYLDAQVKKGDIVLVKGSQSMRMEKAVKDIMAEPLRAKELLVRQYGNWLD